MRGNFSRGIETDRKRGKKYTRVLVEQGSPILDSDLAAMVDAEHHIDRDIVKFLGCKEGSSDLGFFVTPGVLLAHFDPRLGTSFAGTGAAEFGRDYGQKYLERLPGLKISGTGGTVKIDLRHSIKPPQTIRFWVKANEAVLATIGGKTVSIPNATSYQPVDVDFTGSTAELTDLIAQVEAGKTYWIALIETHNPSDNDLDIHYANGSFEIDGVITYTVGGSIPEMVTSAGSNQFVINSSLTETVSTQSLSEPSANLDTDDQSNESFTFATSEENAENSQSQNIENNQQQIGTNQQVQDQETGIPMAAGPGGLALAYLEICEQFISEVDDPGIVEQALGGDVHTSIRSGYIGKIRLAKVSGLTEQQALNKAFEIALPTGRVKFGVSTAALTLDPCDLPIPGGYTGPDNRLYLLSVHSVSGNNAEFKWSRNNGAENYQAEFPSGFTSGSTLSSIRVLAGSSLKTGDLIELYSDAITYGDETNGVYGNNGLQRAVRAQGYLFRLGESVPDGTYRVFNLLHKTTHAAVTSFDPTALGQGQLKLTKWDGLIQQTGTAIATHELEHGINAEINGKFEPRDSWQYEVRTNVQNANGPIVTEPHGNERLFAPLGLFQQTPSGQPAKLLGWLDSRFPKLCELHADDINFDNSYTGSESDTVQEALDELFTLKQEVIEIGCGELVVKPDDNIQDIIDAIPENEHAHLCLAKGTHKITQPINIQNKGEITISGNGRASLLINESGHEVIRAKDCMMIDLREFVINSTPETPSKAPHVVRVNDCQWFRADQLNINCPHGVHHGASGIRVEGSAVKTKVKITDCRVTVGNEDTGLSIINVRDAVVKDNHIFTLAKPAKINDRLQDPIFMGRISRLLMDHIKIEEIKKDPAPTTGVDPNAPGTPAGAPNTPAEQPGRTPAAVDGVVGTATVPNDTIRDIVGAQRNTNSTSGTFADRNNFGGQTFDPSRTNSARFQGLSRRRESATLSADIAASFFDRSTFRPTANFRSVGLTTTDFRNYLTLSGSAIALDPRRPIGVNGLSNNDQVTKSRTTHMGAYFQSTLAQWGQYRISFYSLPIFSSTDWQKIIQANPIPAASKAPKEFLETRLNRFRRELVKAIFGLPSSAKLPTSVLGPASIFRSTINEEYEYDMGHTGIRVGVSQGLRRKQRLRGRVRSITSDLTHTVQISGNRVFGFAKGIHVGPSNGWGKQPSKPRKTFFTNHVNIEQNIVHFPAVAYGWGKDRRRGIAIGNAISASVSGNRVQADTKSPHDAAPYGNCIEFWGHFGPMISVKNNMCSFGKYGVRVKQLNRDGLLYPGTSWTVEDNAYFGQGTPLQV